MQTRKINIGFYRGSRPESAADVFYLKNDLHIENVICLQGHIVEHFQVVQENKLIIADGMNFYHCAWNLVTPPTAKDIKEVLDLIKLNTYVHCHDGVDRTGVLCLAYRIINDKYTFGQALGEMIDDGFHLDNYFWWLPTIKKEIECLKKNE